MQWFKLYGAEMLADPKYQRLNSCERSCWITLLCLASLDDGIVKHCEESYLITHSGIDPLSPDYNKCHGILVKLEMLGMIKRGRDNAGLEYIVIINWKKRQDQRPMTGYERLKKHRDKAKQLTHDNEMITLDNGKNRIEENRIDKGFSKENLSLQEDYEIRDEDEVEKKSIKSKDNRNDHIRRHFREVVGKELGVNVVDSVAAAAAVKRALTRLTPEQCVDKIDEWLTRAKNDQSLMSITACFSDNEVNGYLVGYAKK